MFDVMPEVFRRSRRGLCPTCGAPLELEGSGHDSRCGFCGGDCTLEHRLRKLEPEVDGPAPAQAPKGATRWLKLQGRRERCECPGCGSEFDTRAGQSIQRCPYCGSESKLEARLVPILPKDVQPPQRRTRADLENQKRGRIEYPWDVGTEQLCWRVINEPDLMKRMSLAAEFENWGRINLTTAHFLPHLLQHVQQEHEGVARGVCDAVGKLLCSDDADYALPVLQACAGVVFGPRCKRCVLSELALGTGVCVKLLLDAAEAAAARGARDHACHALWGVNTIFGRNFGQHEIMAEIILYRMFYLTGTVLGWAVYIMQSGFHAGYKLPWPKLVRALDDFAAERPELVPQLRKCFYVGPAKDAAEYCARLDALRAVGPLARAAAGHILGAPPGDDESLALQAMELLHPLLPDGPWAVTAMRGVIKGCENVPESVRQFIKRNLANLPVEIKRELRWKKADEGILPPEEKYYYSSDPKDEPTPELQAMIDDWDEGIRAAVAAYRGESDALRPLRDEARRLDVPIFLDDEGETLEPKQVPARPPEEPREEDKPLPAGDDYLTRESMRLQQVYADQVTRLSTQMQQPGVAEADVARISAQMMDLAQRLQRDIQKLFETRGQP